MEVGDYLQTVASRVRKLRLLRNISQREMAQRIELSLRAYQGFEATGNIALNNFVRILAIFDRKGALLDVLTNTSSFRAFGDNKERRHKLRQRARKPRRKQHDALRDGPVSEA